MIINVKANFTTIPGIWLSTQPIIRNTQLGLSTIHNPNRQPGNPKHYNLTLPSSKK